MWKLEKDAYFILQVGSLHIKIKTNKHLISVLKFIPYTAYIRFGISSTCHKTT